MRRLLTTALACISVACQPIELAAEKIVVVLIDDIGTDKIGAYAEHPFPPATPRLDGLADNGRLFRNAWATPTCTPTRVAMLTGQHPRVWDSYRWVRPNESWNLPTDAFTIPDLLSVHRRSRWDQSFVGKWHLTGLDVGDPPTHPLRHGWNWYAGSLSNLDRYIGDKAFPGNYTGWQKNTNGELAWTETYATTDTIDDAIARVDAMKPPWVLWVSMNAAHTPLNPPPESLHPAMPPDATPAELFDATVTAMDTEIGRLLDVLDADTTIIVMGDNGTSKTGAAPPATVTTVKNSLFEGGLHVPLIISGPLVDAPGTETAARVQAVDIFATLADIAGVSAGDLPDEIHGQSWLPMLTDPLASGATHQFASLADNNQVPPKERCQAVRDDRWKLVLCDSGETSFYDLQGLDVEGPDLIKDRAMTEEEVMAMDTLSDVLADWVERMDQQRDRLNR